MARQAKSDAAKVVDFFRNAPVDVVVTVHEIVHGIVKERTPVPAAKKAPKPKAAKVAETP